METWELLKIVICGFAVLWGLGRRERMGMNKQIQRGSPDSALDATNIKRLLLFKRRWKHKRFGTNTKQYKGLQFHSLFNMTLFMLLISSWLSLVINMTIAIFSLIKRKSE